MHKLVFVAPLMLGLCAPVLAQETQTAPQAPAQAAPVEQAAPNVVETAPLDQQAMQPQAPQVQGESLPPACAPAAGLSGSEQSMGTADMSGLEHMGEGNDQLISATSALQVQLKSAVAQENIDIAYACALVALFNGLKSITAVQTQFGQDATIRQPAERVLQSGEQDIAGVVDWLNTQEPSGSAAQ